MAGKGPPRTPFSVLQARGSKLANARSLEPRVEPGMPEKPPHLSKEASEEWDRIASRIAEIPVARIDETALVLLCHAWADYCTARRALRKHGAMFKTPQGFVAKNPEVTMMNESFERWRKLALQFGITPAARANLTTRGQAQSNRGLRSYDIG